MNQTTAKLLELRTRISVALSVRLLIIFWKMGLIGLGLYHVELNLVFVSGTGTRATIMATYYTANLVLELLFALLSFVRSV